MDGEGLEGEERVNRTLARTALVAAAILLAACGSPAADGGWPPPYENRPRVELTFDVADDLRTVAGFEEVDFVPDLRVCELVFRTWPNEPLAARAGTSLVVTDAVVDGIPVTPRVRAAGAPTGAPGTLVELPLSNCVEPGTVVRAELAFELTLGEDADGPIGVAPAEEVAWFAGAFPLLAWVRGEGWAREEAVAMPGETATSEAFELVALSVNAPAPYAVLGTGSPAGTSPGARSGTTTHRFTAAAVRNVAVSVGRYDVREQEVSGVRMRVGVPSSGSRASAEQWLDVHARTLEEVEELLGAFPYRNLWVTVAPAQSSGIEFPTALQYGDLAAEERAGLVAHELAHQWTYSLVGNNQARDPWLDEAFATYAEAVVTGRADDHPLSDVDHDVAGYLGYPMSYWAETGGFDRYYRGVYSQGASVLLAARQRVGTDEFDAAVRSYLEQNAHAVAAPEDVRAAFADVPGVIDLLAEYGAFAAPRGG